MVSEETHRQRFAVSGKSVGCTQAEEGRGSVEAGTFGSEVQARSRFVLGHERA